jgi:hypothetical protein
MDSQIPDRTILIFLVHLEMIPCHSISMLCVRMESGGEVATVSRDGYRTP